MAQICTRSGTTDSFKLTHIVNKLPLSMSSSWPTAACEKSYAKHLHGPVACKIIFGQLAPIAPHQACNELPYETTVQAGRMAAEKILALAHVLNELPLTDGVESAHSSLYEIQCKPSHGPIACAISHRPPRFDGLESAHSSL